MDIEFVRKSLGNIGILGVALAALGVAVFGMENRRKAVGAFALVAGSSLVSIGLMGGFLRAMNMDLEDLQ